MRHTTRYTVTCAASGLVVGALALAGVPAQAAQTTSRVIGGTTTAGARAPQIARGDDSPGPKVITTSPGRRIARPSGLAADAEPDSIAKAVVGARAAQLGLRGDLRTDSVRPTPAGGSIVRLQQTFGGVPVLGGEIVVDVDAEGRTRSAISETLAGAVPSTTARVTRAGATRTITALISKYTGHPASELKVATPTLALYDAAILGAAAQPGAAGARLVWQSEVTGTTDLALRRQLLIDATTGKKVLDLDLINEAKDRTVCDGLGGANQVPCTSPVRTEGSPAVAPADDEVNKAYDYAGKTYDFYLTTLGRDSIDNAGMTIKSTVRYCPTGATCPYANAFWNGSQMVYGTTYAGADDVVAHELTHGVTERSNGLFYYFQSGAINEALSDIFGEFVDLTDGVGNDDPSVRWKMGEDLPIGAIRDMKNPGAYGDPDRTDSPSWKANTITTANSFDAGGVHSNSGVGNKFAFLLTDGQVFNGYTVTGIGVDKAARIIYGASQRMTSASDYRGFAEALRTSCSANIGTAGIAADDCVQVDSAIKATKMDVMPPTATTPSAAICPAGTVTATRFSDSLDNPASGRWTMSSPSTLSPSAAHSVFDGTTTWPLWFYGDQATYYGPGTAPRYAGSQGGNNLWGDDLDASDSNGLNGFPTDAAIQTTTAVPIPAGTTYMRFTHAFGFETNFWNTGDPLENFDGGVVEYSTNNGATWVDAGSLMAGAGDNGYGYNTSLARPNSILTTAHASTNPLKGRKAFTWQSQGYVSSRANVSSLAGKSVKFRFRIGADETGGDYGWFIDDVSVYSCVPLISAPAAVVFGPTRLTWAAPDSTNPSTKTYRIASATFGRPLSAYGAVLPVPASRVITLAPSKGGTVCIWTSSRVTATGATSTVARCVTVPIDDRALKASSGWKKTALSTAFAKTLRTATKQNKTLTLSGARGTHVVVLARTAKKGGTVAVYVNGKKVGTISLKSSRPGAKQVDFRVSGLAGGKVVLKVIKAGAVTIDGVAVRP